MITTILFDLDGTLLPIEEQPFLELYMGLMAKRFSSFGHDGKAVVKAVMVGTDAMRKNRGPLTNSEVFWNVFKSVYPQANQSMLDEFERFYAEDFDKVQPSSKTNPLARKTIDLLKEKGYRIALATNPLFPRIATEKRIRWAGLEPHDFEFITTYETSVATKPSALYYQSVLDVLKVKADECVMVGNDAKEDMSSALLGISTYLMTDCLINLHNLDLEQFTSGSFEDFYRFVKDLPIIK